MRLVGFEQLWAVLVAVAAWPVGIIVVVIVALVFAPREHQADVLRAVAEIVRAARRTSRR